MLPPQRGQILQQRVVQRLAVGTQSTGGTLQIDRVPQHDGRRHQIEAAGPVALLLKTAVADFTQSVEEDRPGQRVARLALIGVCSRNGIFCTLSRWSTNRSRTRLDFEIECQFGVYPNLMSGRIALNVRIEFVLLFIDTFHQR